MVLEGGKMNLISVARQLFGLETQDEVIDQVAGGETPAKIVQWSAGGRRRGVKNVAWTLTIEDMYADINPQEILVRTVYDGDPHSVWVPLKLSDYPEILASPAGTRMRAQGQIRMVQGEDIYLQECSIEFLAGEQI
jgi:hypothetical protein